MKATYFIPTLVLSGSLHSQSGINTSNPQGIFNADGGKNNPAFGVPSAIQAADDFTVLSGGNVGIGTTSPTAKLTVNGNMILGTMIGTGRATGVSQIVRDSSTGELKIATYSRGNTNPISSHR